MHGTIFFFFHGRDLGVAEFVRDVVVRIVTFFGAIQAITVGIVERSQVLGDALGVFIARMGRPILDDGRDSVTVFQLAIFEVAKEFVNLCAGNLEDLIPTSAGSIRNGGLAVDGQRTSKVVVTYLTETQGSALQLVVDVDTGNPQGTGKQGSSRTIGRNVVLGACTSRKVPPHVAARVDTRSNVVDVQPFE